MLATELSLAAVVGAAAGLLVSASSVLPTSAVVDRGPAEPGTLLVLLGTLVVVVLLVAPVARLAAKRALTGRAVEQLDG